jgi:hypothetical protein
MNGAVRLARFEHHEICLPYGNPVPPAFDAVAPVITKAYPNEYIGANDNNAE